MQNTLPVRRAEHRLSQRDLAKLAGIGPDRYWRIENDHQEPTEHEIATLARVLRTPAGIIFPALAVSSAVSR